MIFAPFPPVINEINGMAIYFTAVPFFFCLCA